MKCPKCKSSNTRKVWVTEPNWHIGHQICLDCKYQDDWGLFCDPPIIVDNPYKILIPGIDDMGDNNGRSKN